MSKNKSYTDVVSMLKDMNLSKKFIKNVQDSIEQRSLSNALSALRLKKGWSQEQMAKKIGWSQEKVSRFEMKKNADMKLGNLRSYCTALGHQLSINII